MFLETTKEYWEITKNIEFFFYFVSKNKKQIDICFVYMYISDLYLYICIWNRNAKEKLSCIRILFFIYFIPKLMLYTWKQSIMLCHIQSAYTRMNTRVFCLAAVDFRSRSPSRIWLANTLVRIYSKRTSLYTDF